MSVVESPPRVPSVIEGSASGEARARVSISRILRDYLSLTKPRIAVLLLLTEFTSMLVIARGWPGTPLVLWALLAGYLSSGGASAINCWFDRDIDAVMRRTRPRPIPSGRVRPISGLIFGVALSGLGFATFWLISGPPAALLALAGGAIYVLVYTMWLKRWTKQNIVIGGAAGAMPPLVASAVVVHTVTPLALCLFAIVFLWTPPHFWSLALMLRRDYGDAKVPMHPVVAGGESTQRAIVAYALLLLVASLVPAIWLGLGYLVVAAI